MGESIEEASKRIFASINMITCNEPFPSVVGALADHIVAACCFVTENRGEAIKKVRSLLPILEESILEHFDHYHERRGTPVASGGGHA